MNQEVPQPAAPPAPVPFNPADIRRPRPTYGSSISLKRLAETRAQALGNYPSNLFNIDASGRDSIPVRDASEMVHGQLRSVVSTDPIIYFRPGDTAPYGTIIACAEIGYLMMAASQERRVRLGGLFSVISCLLPNALEDNTIVTALRDASYKVEVIKPVSVNDALQCVLADAPQDCQGLLDVYGSTIATHQMGTKEIILSDVGSVMELLGQIGEINHCYAMCGLMLTLMGKIVTPENANPWRNARWKAFCGCVGLSFTSRNIFSNKVLEQNVLEEIGKFFATNPAVRRRLLEMILVHVEKETPQGKICATVAKYLRWTELSHILLINTYIFMNHPHVVYMRELQPHVNDYLRALNKLHSISSDANMWCYIKIMHPESQLEFLNRQKFQLLTSIAQQIGTSYQASLNNYKGGFSQAILTPHLQAIKLKAVALAWMSDQLPELANIRSEDVHNIMKDYSANLQLRPDESLDFVNM